MKAITKKVCKLKNNFVSLIKKKNNSEKPERLRVCLKHFLNLIFSF